MVPLEGDDPAVQEATQSIKTLRPAGGSEALHKITAPSEGGVKIKAKAVIAAPREKTINRRTSTILRQDHTQPNSICNTSKKGDHKTSSNMQLPVTAGMGDDVIDSEVKALIVPGSATSSEYKIETEVNRGSNRQFVTLQTQNVNFPITFEVANIFRDTHP